MGTDIKDILINYLILLTGINMKNLWAPNFILAMIFSLAMIGSLFIYHTIDQSLSSIVMLIIGYYFGKEQQKDNNIDNNKI